MQITKINIQAEKILDHDGGKQIKTQRLNTVDKELAEFVQACSRYKAQSPSLRANVFYSVWTKWYATGIYASWNLTFDHS